MATNWNNREQNPAGIKATSWDNHPPVKVSLEARPLGQFRDAQGFEYVCVLIEGRRRVFKRRKSGYDEEVLDQNLKFVISQMTAEHLE
ncbi:MAG: hypothetical protein ABSD20_04695 [Terriglobales bacterium]|jgi:hypothetical protein